MTEAEKESAATDSGETAAASETEPGVGAVFSMAREQRSVSPSSAATGSRVPLTYIQMIESGDYARIADQIYLVPFVRRYAAFLALDPEDMVTRFVQEVQRADLIASRIVEPIDLGDPSRRRLPLWLWVGGLLLAVAVGYGAAAKVHSWRMRKAVSSQAGRNAASTPRPQAPSAAPAQQKPPTAPMSSSGAAGPAGPAQAQIPVPSKVSAAPGLASDNRRRQNTTAKR